MSMDYEGLCNALTEARMHLLEDELELHEAMQEIGDALAEEDDAGVTMDGAENPDPVPGLFWGYVDTIVARLADMGLSEEEALGVIEHCAEEMAKEGHLPPLPDDEEAEALTAWLGAAQSVGFEDHVYSTAAEE